MEVMEKNVKEYYRNIAKTGSSCCPSDRCRAGEESAGKRIPSKDDSSCRLGLDR